MIVGVVLFAAAAEEVLLHPGDPLAGFSRLLFALSFGLVVLAQSAVLVRVGHPVPVERIAAAGLIMLLMTPELNVRANLMMLAVIVLLVLALVVERLRASGPALH